MLYLKKHKKDAFQLLAVIVPLLFSVLSVIFKSYYLIVAAVISLFGIIGIMPVFKRHENLWMFVLSTIVFMPQNLMIVYYFIREDIYGFIMNELVGFLVFCSLFSVEQIVLGVVTRILWRRQCRLSLDF